MKQKMKIDAGALLQALSAIAPAVKKNSIIPILEYVHVKPDSVFATSLGMSIKKEFAFPAIGDLDAVISFHELKNICHNCKGSEMTIEQTIGNYEIKIKSGSDIYKLNGMNPAEIPVMSSDDDAVEIPAAAWLINELRIASIFCNPGDPRPALASVMMFSHNGFLQIAGTNANKLYTVRCAINAEVKCCIDPTFVAAIASEGIGVLTVGKKNICFKSDDLTVVSVLLEGKIPDVNAVLPKTKANIKANANELILAVQKASSLRGALPFTLITLAFKPGGADVLFLDNDLNREIKTECSMEHDLQPGERISLNAAYLITLLSAIDSDEVAIAYTEPTKAVTFRTSNPMQIAMLMPIVDPLQQN